MEQLLKKIEFSVTDGDHLILTGDIISKGPDSGGVVDLARELGASCVRGNHEDRILLLRHEMITMNTLLAGDEKNVKLHEPSEKEAKERALARSLSEEQARWLEACPVILDVGSVQGIGQVVVVHAGLVPGVELEKQDPSTVMTMRTMDLDTHVPSEKTEGMSWAKVSCLLGFDPDPSVLTCSSRCLINTNPSFTLASNLHMQTLALKQRPLFTVTMPRQALRSGHIPRVLTPVV